MAEIKPIQLKDSSAADAMATPTYSRQKLHWSDLAAEIESGTTYRAGQLRLTCAGNIAYSHA